MLARAREEPLKKGEKCHQVLCRIGGRGWEKEGGGEEDLTPMKEGRRNDRERIRGKGEGVVRGKRERKRDREGGRSLNGDRPTTVPTELLAVVRRFRESNLSCDHLRECLNELLGVGPETTSLRELLSARHLV